MISATRPNLGESKAQRGQSRQATIIRTLCAVLLLLLVLLAQSATMLSIGDGDTLVVVEGCRRLTSCLACIDTPETAQNP